MFLKPFPGMSVPDLERGGLLAAEGRPVAPTTYWQRRLDVADVVEITEDEYKAGVADKEHADAAAAKALTDTTVQTSAPAAKADKAAK